MTQHIGSRYAPVILVLALILVSCSTKESLDHGAEKMARAYWNTLFTVCSDSFVITRDTLNKHASIGYTEKMLAREKNRDGFNPLETYQYRGVTILVRKDAAPIDFQDQLFDTKWKGKTELHYNMSRTYWPNKGEWGEWVEKEGTFTVRLVKREGRWTIYGLNNSIIDEDRISKVLGNVARVNCDNLSD